MINRLWKLDIFDLNYAFDEHLEMLSLPSSALPRAGVWVRVVSFFWHLLDGLLHLGVPFAAKGVSKGSILFFAQSINQVNAIESVAKETPAGYLVGPHNLPVDRKFPKFWAYLTAIPFLPFVLWHYVKARDYRRRTYSYSFDRYWLTYGYYFVVTLWLQRLLPSTLVVANDHNMEPRVITRVAHELGIPTVYLQHASVTAKFPPLSFDFALLDGIDALKKYDQIGDSETVVFLIGIPKLDAYLKWANSHTKVTSVGICTNALDSLADVETLCTSLRNLLPDLPVTLRPHPADKRIGHWQELAQRCQAGFCDPRREISFEFLRKVDAVIVGESNILLEAALMNVYPLYYDFGRTAKDHYGFICNGLTQYSSRPEEIVEQLRMLLESKPDVQARAKHYCATVGTSYAGRSSELAGGLIHCIASGEEIDLGMWQRVPCTNLEAYELTAYSAKPNGSSHEYGE